MTPVERPESTICQYRRKSRDDIRAVRWDGTNWAEVEDVAKTALSGWDLAMLESWLRFRVGVWVTSAGTMTDPEFKEKYEPV